MIPVDDDRPKTKYFLLRLILGIITLIISPLLLPLGMLSDLLFGNMWLTKWVSWLILEDSDITIVN